MYLVGGFEIDARDTAAINGEEDAGRGAAVWLTSMARRCLGYVGNRAAVRVFEVGIPHTKGKTSPRAFAHALHDGAAGQWRGVVRSPERDMLGDDLVPDYATTVKEGAFYGWPWYYMGLRRAAAEG